MMVAIPGADGNLLVASKYDYETRSFKGPMRTVLSKSGCYLTVHTAPVEAYDREYARSTETILQILTLQILN